MMAITWMALRVMVRRIIALSVGGGMRFLDFYLGARVMVAWIELIGAAIVWGTLLPFRFFGGKGNGCCLVFVHRIYLQVHIYQPFALSFTAKLKSDQVLSTTVPPPSLPQHNNTSISALSGILFLSSPSCGLFSELRVGNPFHIRDLSEVSIRISMYYVL